MTLSRRSFFGKTAGAVTGVAALGVMAVAVTPEQVEEKIKADDDLKSSDVYADIPAGAAYYEVIAGERVVPGDLLIVGPMREDGEKDERVYAQKPGRTGRVVGICISYDDEDKSCVMASTGSA